MKFSEIFINELYTDKLSYSPGETVKIYASTRSFFSSKITLTISTITHSFYDKMEASISHQKANSENVLKDGLNYNGFIEYKIPENCKSGIYLINNTYPFIVKSKLKSKITVVYPAMNNILYTPIDGRYSFENKLSKTSFHRTVFVDDFTRGVSDFFKTMEDNYSVNYISDLDLEKSNLILSNLIIVYGRSVFWTQKMRKSLFVYLKNGGNMLNITSHMANDICWYNKESELTLVDTLEAGTIKRWPSQDRSMPLSISGIAYIYSGYSAIKTYDVVAKNNPIMQEVSNKSIEINGNLFSGPPIKWVEDVPMLDLDSLGFYDGEIIASSEASFNKNRGLKGIFMLQPDSTSGKIVSLGTEDWCLKYNIGEKEQLQLITKNAIAYLLD